MQQDILLFGKRILVSESPILLSYQPGEDWKDIWDVKLGHWECKDGYLIGSEPGNFGGILLSKQHFENDVMMRFKMATVLPATSGAPLAVCPTYGPWSSGVSL